MWFNEVVWLGLTCSDMVQPNILPAEPLKVSIQNVLMPSESKIDKNINTLLGKIFEK